jgi:hypothetical protein
MPGMENHVADLRGTKRISNECRPFISIHAEDMRAVGYPSRTGSDPRGNPGADCRRCSQSGKRELAGLPLVRGPAEAVTYEAGRQQ